LVVHADVSTRHQAMALGGLFSQSSIVFDCLACFLLQQLSVFAIEMQKLGTLVYVFVQGLSNLQEKGQIVRVSVQRYEDHTSVLQFNCENPSVEVATSFKVPGSPSKTFEGSGRIRASPSSRSLDSGGKRNTTVLQSNYKTG
jgi:hypothetical protein